MTKGIKFRKNTTGNREVKHANYQDCYKFKIEFLYFYHLTGIK